MQIELSPLEMSIALSTATMDELLRVLGGAKSHEQYLATFGFCPVCQMNKALEKT